MDDPIPSRATDLNFFGDNPHGDERGSVSMEYFKLPVKVAVLSWGALAWDPGDLPLVCDDPEHPESAWLEGGPEVPIEFSRVAVDCRLIPVIDPVHGVPCATLYARSRRNDRELAIQDLMKAEHATNPKRIGFIDNKENKHRALTYMQMADPIKAWAKEHDVDCVIWAELPSNFSNHTGRDFSLEAAVKYLGELPKFLVEQAKEYVDRAPKSIDTPLRRKLAEEGWPGLS